MGRLTSISSHQLLSSSPLAPVATHQPLWNLPPSPSAQANPKKKRERRRQFSSSSAHDQLHSLHARPRGFPAISKLGFHTPLLFVGTGQFRTASHQDSLRSRAHVRLPSPGSLHPSIQPPTVRHTPPCRPHNRISPSLLSLCPET
ncbi:hypothetical protein CCM_03127 [Cordyceps militaris CM01]|uniref:Uncharacterized protein n=1 Tax=Cordyceps militaris (strain CM01) TaxID=983644 RepID=G3J8X3_CORMM|nr:uncharacterized protein CCM_03127 [Cordyceps militaris CM01]EGX94856.1 hypothetical protein CCM_03127 [Cordyceps militaris CM01]